MGKLEAKIGRAVVVFIVGVVMALLTAVFLDVVNILLPFVDGRLRGFFVGALGPCLLIAQEITEGER